MKRIKIFLLFLLAFSMAAHAQYPPPGQIMGSPSSIIHIRGGGITDSALIIAKRDTTNHPGNYYNGANGGGVAITFYNGNLYYRYDSAWVKVINFTPTQQQVFNTQNGSTLTKIDTFLLPANIGLHLGGKTASYFDFKDDSSGNVPRIVKFTTDKFSPIVRITGDNVQPQSFYALPEQLVIDNPTNTGGYTQALIGFSTYNGTKDSTTAWVGATSANYTFGPFPNSAYLESFNTGGVQLLSDHPTLGEVGIYVGGYTDTTFRRQRWLPNGSTDFYGSNGTLTSFNFRQRAESGAAQSYIPINWYVPTTGLIGQLVPTANNYSSTLNIPKNSIGLLSEATSGAISLIAGETGGNIRFTAGGYGSANEIMRITVTGVGIGNTAPGELLSLGTAGTTSGIYSVAGSSSGKITFQPQATAGTYNLNWPITAGSSGQLLTSAGGGSSAMTWTSQSALSVSLSSVTAMTTGATINNANFTEEMQWNTLNANSGIKFSSTSIAGSVASTRKIVEVASSGANTNAVRTFGIYSRVANTNDGGDIGVYGEGSGDAQSYGVRGFALGTGGNVGGDFSASGGSVNYSIIAEPGGGNVGIGNSAPGQLLTLGTPGTISGIFSVAGSTSGIITFQPQVTSGTYNMNWPTTAGSSGQVLTSQGGGSTAMTWSTVPSGTGNYYFRNTGATGNSLLVAVNDSTIGIKKVIAGTGITITNADSSETFISNLSTGVSGGQSVIGGTGSGDNLTISSTTNGTKGRITISDSVNFNGQSIENYAAKINQISGTSYTLVAADNGKILQFTSGSAITLTVPAGLPTGFTCTVDEEGAGQVTFTASSTTIHNRQSFTKTAGQYAIAAITMTAANVFTTGGDMQ